MTVNIPVASCCPFLSVDVMPDFSHYTPFDISAAIDPAEASLFEKLLLQNEKFKTSDSALLNALVSAVCSHAVENILCCGEDFAHNTNKLVSVFSLYCSKNLLRGKLVGQWLCDLCLVTGKAALIPEFSSLGIPVPFSDAFCTGNFIHSFLDNQNDFSFAEISGFLKCSGSYPAVSPAVFEIAPEICRKIICTVLRTLFDYLRYKNGSEFFIPKEKTVVFNTFTGLPCREECFKKVRVVYVPYNENTELSALVSDVLCCTENLIRQGFGMKSKISGFTLAAEYRKLVSDTVRETVPDLLPPPAKVGRKPGKKIRPEPEKKTKPEYIPEAVDLNIDISNARKLEAESWKLTDMLYANYGGNDITFNADKAYVNDDRTQIRENADDQPLIRETVLETVHEKASESAPSVEDIPEDWREFIELLSSDEKNILSLIAKGENASEYAKKRGGLLYGYVQSVNEKASDAYGDIILTENGTEFEFIEDYKDELTEIFSALQDTEVL